MVITTNHDLPWPPLAIFGYTLWCGQCPYISPITALTRNEGFHLQIKEYFLHKDQVVECRLGCGPLEYCNSGFESRMRDSNKYSFYLMLSYPTDKKGAIFCRIEHIKHISHCQAFYLWNECSMLWATPQAHRTSEFVFFAKYYRSN
jgi:hypothetical protein